MIGGDLPKASALTRYVVLHAQAGEVLGELEAATEVQAKQLARERFGTVATVRLATTRGRP